MATFILVLALDRLVFKDSLRYKVPETMGIPADFTFDHTGKLWMVDSDGNLLVWSNQGELIQELGGKGEGPGEFQVGWQRLFITSDKENIIVCDEQKINYFSLEGEFLRFDFKPMDMRRRFRFFTRVPNGYLVSFYHYQGERELGKLMSRVVLTDEDFIQQAVIREERDWEWSRTLSGGWHWQPYAPRIEVAVNFNSIFLAMSDDFTVTAYNFEGARLYDFKVKLPLAEVTTEDKRDYRKWFQMGERLPGDKLSFPEYDSRIDHMIPLSDNLMVVYQYKHTNGLVKGVVVDSNDGALKGKVLTYLGNIGRLMADQGKVLAVRSLDAGGFDIKRVSPIFIEEGSYDSKDPQP